MWQDEFDDAVIDTSKWEHEINCDGGGNAELQCYTGSADNSFVDEGKLHIVAQQVGVMGADNAYTSARLITKNQGDWTYGRFEINAKMPQGQGLWPAIWMLPTDYVYGGWPLSGEIDIFEAVNSNTPGFGNTVHGTLHYGSAWPGNVHTGDSTVPATNIWENFHTYAIEWEEGEIRWYVDDVHFATQTADGWYTDGAPGSAVAPFDQAFHLLLNVAVGGNWPQGPNASTVFPQEMVVDYVRVYECSGTECATAPGADGEEEVFTLYEDGPGTLTLDEDIYNTLIPGLYANWDAGGSVVSEPGTIEGDNTLWDIQMTPVANAFLTRGEMGGYDGLANAIKLVNMEGNAEFRFDLKVLSIDPGAELYVMLDSLHPAFSSKAIVVPAPGAWTEVTVAFADLVPNGTGVNYDKANNLFVIEAKEGSAHIQLDNIRIVCPAEAGCDMDPVLSSVVEDNFFIFDDAVTALWNTPGIAFYEPSGNGPATYSIVADSDDATNDVLQVTFGSDNHGISTMYIQSSTPKDLSVFSSGNLLFDLKVINAGILPNTNGFKVRVDCGYPCASAEIPVPMPAVGVWTPVTVPVSSLIGLDLAKVNTPINFFPVGGEQNGVIFHLDNIRWELAP